MEKQEMEAAQPALVTEPSERKRKVRQPELELIVPPFGSAVPLYVPIRGAAVEVPSVYIEEIPTIFYIKTAKCYSHSTASRSANSKHAVLIITIIAG